MRSTRRQQHTEAERRPLVEAWRRGEGTQAQLAARHGMPSPTFAWWCGKLRRDGAPRRDFVAVDVRPCTAPSDRAFEVEIAGGRFLRVPPGFDDGDLRRLLAALGVSC